LLRQLERSREHLLRTDPDRDETINVDRPYVDLLHMRASWLSGQVHPSIAGFSSAAAKGRRWNKRCSGASNPAPLVPDAVEMACLCYYLRRGTGRNNGNFSHAVCPGRGNSPAEPANKNNGFGLQIS
jgi:hypothetical protein